MLGGRAFQTLNSADEPEFLFLKHMTSSELRNCMCWIPEVFALTHFPAFAEGKKSTEVVFLDERMNGWKIAYKSRLRRNDPNGSSVYALREGWQKVIEDKDLQNEDCVSFFRFRRSYIFLAIRRTAARTLKVLESRSRELILLHPDQVRSAKLLASNFFSVEEHFVVEYIACIYGMFEARGSQIQGGASRSTASPTLSLQDFEAIYQLFRERAQNGVGLIELEESHLPYRIPRNFCGQDFDSTYRMIQERRNLRAILAGTASSPGQVCIPLQSTERQVRFYEVDATRLSAYPTPSSHMQNPISHFGYDPQMFQSTGTQTQGLQFADAPGSPYPTYYIVNKQFPGENFAGDVFQNREVWKWIGAQIQASVPSFMASQSQYPASGSLSGQSSGEQTQAGQPSFTASQSQYQASGSLSGQSLEVQTQAGAPSFMPCLSQYQASGNLSEQSSGAQTQAGAPSFMASQSQYQASRSLSRQSSGAQAQAGAPSFMASQIEQGTLTNTFEQDPIPDHGIAQERGALNQEAVETSNGTHTNPQMFQSTGALAGPQTQTQVGATSFPAYPTSSRTRPRLFRRLFPDHLTVSIPHFPHFSYQIVLMHYVNPTRILSAFVPRTNPWTGAQIHESIPNSVTHQNQYQTPRSFSGQSSGAQAGAPIFTGAPSLRASQIQHGTLSSSSRQNSLPSNGMAQGRGAPTQGAAETSYAFHQQLENPTTGTQIQAQEESYDEIEDSHGEGEAAEE